MSKEKLNMDMLEVLNENIKNPFLIISPEGNIVSYNKQASHSFAIKSDTGNIFDYLDEDSAYVLSGIIEEVLAGKKFLTKNIILTFTNGLNLKSQATITNFKGTFLFCTFKPEEHNLKIGDITKLKIKQEELSGLIKNPEIEKIINSIKELFPFTVIGKEKVRRDVDQLEEFFWIKNSEGVYLLVNKIMSQSLGLISTQLEGRSEEELLPGYLHAVYSSLENYIRNSHNVIVFEGIPMQGLSALTNYQTIEIPLTDSEGNLTAIIGISQKNEVSDAIPPKKDVGNILEDLPAALAILDGKGIIEHSSKEFCKLFSDEFSDFRNLSYTNVFPLDISDRIKKFLDSYSEVDEFQIKISKQGEWKDRELKVYLKRKSGEKNQPGGLSIFLEDVPPDTDLTSVINSRGRMYEVLIQNNPEPIFIYDKENLHFIEVNQAALNLYGYRRDEFLEMDLTDLYTPEDIQTLLDNSSDAVKEGVFTGPYRHKRKNGESVFVEISKTSFQFNNKDAHFNIIKDVSKQLDLERQNQLFRAAFDNAKNLIFTTDPSGFIKSANNVSVNLLNIKEADLINSSFASLVEDDERGVINSKIFQSSKNEAITLNTILKKEDGKPTEVEVTANPIFNYKNEIESFILVIKPIVTDSAEKSGTKVKEIIVEKIVEKKVESQSKIDPAFLSGIFHEILTPINAMLGFVQELSESIENTTPEQKEAKEIIDQNRRRLLSTMNSVIEYSRMEQEDLKVEIKDISITEIVDETQEEISDILKNKGIDFAYGKISSSLNFKTDPPKFVSLITLLFKIASQFSSTKKIYFSAYQIDDKNFLISIQDNYSSMSPSFSENFNNIFNSREIQIDYGFSKLSIKLARNLIALLQGKFIEKSKKQSGFVFPVELHPLEPQESQVKEKDAEVIKEPENSDKASTKKKTSEINEEEPESGEEEFQESEFEETQFTEKEPAKEPGFVQHSSLNRKRTRDYESGREDVNKSRIDLSQLTCLYIEDQVDSQILFKVQLKGVNNIKFAVSFEEALPLLDTHHFDFIVLDINLQGEYNGLDALKVIHRMPGYETIPIIAVTAYVLPGDREKFIAAGFNDFISKPIFREKMMDALEKIFSLMQS